MDRIKGLPVDGESVISEAEPERQGGSGIPPDKEPCKNSEFNENLYQIQV